MNENLDSAAKEYADSFNISDFYMGSDIKEALTQAFEAGAQWQKQQNAEASGKWIPVTERLPDERVYVLARGSQGGYDVTFIFNGRWMTHAGVITHWKPFTKLEIDRPALPTKIQKTDFQKLWEQSIQLDDLHAFDDAPVACPPGYRVPTGEEQDWLLANTDFSFDEEKKEGVFRFADGFELRLPAAGYRDYSFESSFRQGIEGNYWSSSVNGISARNVYFNGDTVYAYNDYRAYGFSVRCLPIEIK